jgi:hypothetical protein
MNATGPVYVPGVSGAPVGVGLGCGSGAHADRVTTAPMAAMPIRRFIHELDCDMFPPVRRGAE